MTDQTISLGDVTASSANSFSVSTPSIVQYPKPPPNISGKWISFSTILASVIKAGFSGANEALSAEADAAEGKWKNLLAQLQQRNVESREQADDIAEDDIANLHEHLIPYLDSLMEMIRCGCRPDYESIRMQNSGGADTIRIEAQYETIRNKTNTYHVGVYNDAGVSIEEDLLDVRLRDTIRTRESARQSSYACNLALRSKALESVANTVQQRKQTALQYKDEALKGLAGLMQTYAWLATSKRSAAKLKGNEEGEALANSVLAVFTGIYIANMFSPDSAKGEDAGGCKP